MGYKLLGTTQKLQLEAIYNEYCISELDAILDSSSNLEKNEIEEIEMMKQFIKFRLSVSGGAESCMGSIGCGSVSGFLDEIMLYNDMMTDWGGAYRGDFSYEHFDFLVNILNKSDVTKDIQNEITEEFKLRYSMDNED